MSEKRAAERQEQASHGTIFLPVNSYHCLVPETYTELALHWHHEMEITLIRSGVCDYRVGSAAFHARAGDLIVVPPYVLHSAMELEGQTMVSDSLVFHLDYLGASEPDLAASRYLRPLREGRLGLPVRLEGDGEGYRAVRAGFEAALECFTSREPFYELRLKALLLQTLYALLRYFSLPEADSPRPGHAEQMQTALRYISQHYRERIAIADIAAACGFSESHFMSVFRRNAGMPCIRYINHYRIQQAAREIESTDRQIMEIALECGFENVSFFNLNFRRAFGMTPRAFRRARAQSRG